LPVIGLQSSCLISLDVVQATRELLADLAREKATFIREAALSEFALLPDEAHAEHNQHKARKKNRKQKQQNLSSMGV
jgi:hypothetical protein